MKFFKREPVLLGGILTFIATAASVYGLDISKDQLTQVVALVVAIVTFIQRRNVSPVE